MGYDLHGQGGGFRWTIHDWPDLLGLAYEYGWEPEHKAEYYLGNNYQIISAADATNLADALGKLLPDLSKCDLNEYGEMGDIEFIKKNIFTLDDNTKDIPDLPEESTNEIFSKLSPTWQNGDNREAMQHFSGINYIEKIEDFIQYCHQGEFEIG